MSIFKQRRLLWCFFIGYCIVLFAILFGRNDYAYVNFSRYPYWHRVLDKINLIPLVSIWEQLRSIFDSGSYTRPVALRNLAANVLLFAPMGLFLPMLWEKLRRFRANIKMWFLMIMMIEIVQLLTLQGSFDIDDIILNTVGFLAGFCVYLILNYFIREEK